MKTYLVFILLFIANGSFAQITFQNKYGGPWEDYGCDVILSGDGGYVVTGMKSISENNQEAFIMRTDENGFAIWVKNYGNISADCSNSIVKTQDGGYAMAGYSVKPGDNKYRTYMIRTDGEGDSLWTKVFWDYEYIHSTITRIRTTDDGGFIMVGNQEYENEIFIMKANQYGDTIWKRTYKLGPVSSVLSLTDGGYVFTGVRKNTKSNLGNACLVKTDDHGDTLWIKVYDVDYETLFYSMEITMDGGFIMCGSIYDTTSHKYDMYAVRADSNGNEIWSERYGGTESDYGRAIVQTRDSGFAITGNSQSYTQGAAIILIRTNADGEILWSRTYGGEYDDVGYSIKQTPDSGFIVVGRFWHATVLGFNYDITLLKTDQFGNCDYAIVPGVQPRWYFSVYPNPTQGKLTIDIPEKFGTVKSSRCFDRKGKEIYLSGRELIYDFTSLPSGLYHIVLLNERGEQGVTSIVKE